MNIRDLLFSGARNRRIAGEKDGLHLVKFALKQYFWNCQRALVPSRLRALPDFLLIGVQKGGTSSLYSNLIKHPCVVPAHRKEVNFFSHDINLVKGLKWYRDHFASTAYLKYRRLARGRRVVTGEATPRYIFLPYVAERVATFLPNVRLIAVLRNPVSRAYSHYHMAVRKNVETLPFDQAIEEARREVDRIYSSGFALPRTRADYLSRGLYADQLTQWFEHFPRQQILVLKSEDYYKDPQTTLKTALEFIGVDSEGMAPYSRGRVREKYPPMNEGIRSQLREFFKPHNERLYELVGRDFGWDA